jgi:hypothetical protein
MFELVPGDPAVAQRVVQPLQEIALELTVRVIRIVVDLPMRGRYRAA